MAPLIAGLILAAFWICLISGLREKCLTYDEIGHVTAGFTYWRFGDYRLDPENGNLPQRLMALPLLGSSYRFPSTDQEAWRRSDIWTLGYQWFYGLGNDPDAMTRRGRAVCGLLAVALGALVWAWSRHLFGLRGGFLSLLLFVLCPAILANGALMTSDTAGALFFLASTGGIWAVLHRVTTWRVLASIAALGGLFVSKMSAPLIVPVAVLLVGFRLASGRPLPVEIGWWRWMADRRSRQLAVIGVVALIHLIGSWALVWGCYGFRFSTLSQDAQGQGSLVCRWEVVLGKPDPLALVEQLPLNGEQTRAFQQVRQANPQIESGSWTPLRMETFGAVKRDILTPAQNRQLERMLAAPPLPWPARLSDFALHHKLLPEAFLYGLTWVWKFSGERMAFFNGQVGLHGWRGFFPYAFAVKTPLSILAMMLFALAAALAAGLRGERKTMPAACWRQGVLYESIPLWVLAAVYLAAAIFGNINIGHRHLLPVYAPFIILCGAAAFWIGQWSVAGGASPGVALARRVPGVVVCSLVAALGLEMWRVFPNYLAYFNVFAGGPAHAYRHLVDSSLDWGQDLPGVRRYLERHRPSGPVYLSYFGNGSPDYYLTPSSGVRYLYSQPGRDVSPPSQLLELPPARAQELLAEHLRVHPDYDAVGQWREPDGRLGVLLVKKPSALRLTGGTYLVSATMLQTFMIDADGPVGSWNEWCESTYQQFYRTVKPLLDDDPEGRSTVLMRHSPLELQLLLNCFDAARFQRLVAFLRQREPDDAINGSILVYRLTDPDVSAALDGPPPR